ncbi:type II toxin-antitoxin system RelE/ParE family toxin [Lichenihabitans sp. Uapishka_5]|uniref:type II toxin-antitoxin system RelE/ParE family toxin n=1 Tax=Lichenihabitans sp. Uapishka_5 TaxID=3037302 RepID=UPI0029E7E474|nr:type II toxin-antitoxin system RelE/ParE family toxin [Lichenihabitans sp. Uapishka_5]MDX7952660.1 type II toxin-antitoxin system RelE/ParE family toxin [Lichenihabitans sp. Uapishka_5]
MKRTVVWSNSARDEFLAILRFIAESNPDAAARVAETIDGVVATLGDMATGRSGRVTGTYEKVVPGLPYIVAYALDDQPGRRRVAVLHVIHGARDWPDEGWPASRPSGMRAP